jgi:hypothetical protein
MGETNHSQSIVEQVIPPAELEEIREAITVKARPARELWEGSLEAKYGEQFRKSAFYEWCKRVRDGFDRTREKLALERLRLTYGIRQLADADVGQVEQTAALKLHEILGDIAGDEELQPRSLKQVSEAISLLTKLSFMRDENRRRQESHVAKQAINAAIDEGKRDVEAGKKNPQQAFEDMRSKIREVYGLS